MSQPQWGRQRDLAFDRCHDGIERPPTILEEYGLCERRLFGRQNYSALAPVCPPVDDKAKPSILTSHPADIN